MENNTQNTSAESNAMQMVKPKRGRPRKNPIQAEPLVKRKRGRPRIVTGKQIGRAHV